MDTSQMKNIVVLKNLPSNIVDEAIVVLKPNKMARKLQYTKNNGETKEKSEKSGYIVKEAEMLINKYLEEIESNKKGKKKSNWEKKYNVQKYISIGLAGVALVEFLII